MLFRENHGGPAGRGFQLRVAVAHADGGHELEMVGNVVRLLEFGRVENSLGEAYPAAADALGLGEEHDVASHEGAVVNVPV